MHLRPDDDLFPPGSPWALVAASGRAAAEAYAARRGLDVRCVLSKNDLLKAPLRSRRRIRSAGARGVIVHSTSWTRQGNPQLYELALALIPLRERYIVGEAEGHVERVGTAALTERVVRIPFHALRNTRTIGNEAIKLARRRSRAHLHTSSRSSTSGILVVWPGSGASFGGSLTHIAGILSGFRDCGFRVGLVTAQPLPEPLRLLVDDVEIMHPLPAANRVTRDTAQIAENVSLRRAGVALARRLPLAFVYQRHSPFLVAGADLADSFGVPLFLEWNGSEAWIRRNWHEQFVIERLLDPLLVAMERDVLSRAALIGAVSDEAAAMAVRAGADAETVVVIPNAVDLEEVRMSVDGAPVRTGNLPAVLGWVGSFGPWHGAEIAVRALARLPSEVGLLMVGDGAERETCQVLAASLGLSDRVEMTGGLGHRDALRRLAQCDVLLSPHIPLPNTPFFGSPTKVFEYMALGKPIVASRLGQLGRLLEDGVTARLVTPGDAGEIADAVREILGLPDRGRALGEAARREVVEKHTWDKRTRTILTRLGYAARPDAVSSGKGEA